MCVVAPKPLTISERLLIVSLMCKHISCVLFDCHLEQPKKAAEEQWEKCNKIR